MEKRYQVFVSSTYEDLQAERQEVMHALLELDCIPAGMELFPAANEDQWSLIQRVIEDCDYYIVIVGGRYGSIGPKGISYTEMEYRYALEIGKPIIGFLHKDPEALPSKVTEKEPAKRNKLVEFRTLVESKMCKHWGSATELGSVVSRSLVRLIKNEPAVGWVKADQLPSAELTSELLRLRKRVEELELEIDSVKNTPPMGTDDLAQGDDELELDVDISYWFSEPDASSDTGKFESTKRKYKTTWNRVFSLVSPVMIDEANEVKIKRIIDTNLFKMFEEIITKDKVLAGASGSKMEVSETWIQSLIVQFRALGVITQSIRNRSLKDHSTYWKLTPYGDSLMTKLNAIRRK